MSARGRDEPAAGTAERSAGSGTERASGGRRGRPLVRAAAGADAVPDERLTLRPVSDEEKARHRLFLRLAAASARETGLDGVRMHDLARSAHVALGTLYRHFPSKQHLFVELMRVEMERFARDVPPGDGTDPAGVIADLLVEAGHRLRAEPRLARAMLLSLSSSAVLAPTTAVSEAFERMVLRAAGVPAPTDADRQLIRLVERAWFGILTASLDVGTEDAEADDDTRTACRLLLAGLGA